MVDIGLETVIENGRPRVPSLERRRNPLLRTLQRLWQEYRFQITVVIISFILLFYTIAGKCYCYNNKKLMTKRLYIYMKQALLVAHKTS